MKKFGLIIFMMFMGVTSAFADEGVPVLSMIKTTSDSVTLKVTTKGMNDGDICYLYRSINGVDYDKTMIIDCNMSYVDEGLDTGITYYYKASVEALGRYSEILTINLKDSDGETLNLTRNVNEINNGAMGLGVGIVLIMCLLVVSMFKFKKKLI